MKYITKIPTGHEKSVFVVSVSGGKDSTATAAEMERLRRELGIDVRYVFSDTGWEYPQTYEHLATMERTLGITIDRVGVEGGMVAKIRQRAGFPARKQRWCTRELKVLPLRAYHDALMERESVDTVSVVGIRADESIDRSLLPEFGYDDMWGGYVWRPLINAVIPDVIALHHRHGVPVNPLYKMGFSRVGCTCIYASKEEIELTAEHFPERIDLIRELEHEAEAMRVERNAETPDRYAHAEATYFQAKMVERYVRLRTWVKADGGGAEGEGSSQRNAGTAARWSHRRRVVARRANARLQAYAHRRHHLVVAHLARRAAVEGDSRGARRRVLPLGHVRTAREGGRVT